MVRRTILVAINAFFFYLCVKVKHLEKGLNPSFAKEMISLPVTKCWHYYLQWIPVTCMCCYEPLNFGYGEATTIGRTFAFMKDYQLDGNKEMVALGAMKVVGSMNSCYVATGTFKDVLWT